ncbi:MAG: FMN-binding protein [Synergistaceae bacterium]|jgi:major membrane immunogen (membrane-anchored lipoprotein)|nr:FMN-binding protein [Synergistaceae bacterium]
MKKIYAVLILVVILAVGYKFSNAPEAQGNMKDGYYTAEVVEYDHGWKEFLTIYVNNGKIVTAEYNAKNASGFIKSWDMKYMRLMNEIDGNYPNRYTRTYASALLANQNTGDIDAMSGATNSYHSFKILADAVIVQALAGDRKVAFVSAPHEEN